MSLSDEIRKALANSGEPMSGGEICDALGCETPKERNGVTCNLSAMAHARNGIERLDDGRYSLIPGWKPKRKAACSEPQEPTTVGVEVQADRGVIDGAEAGAEIRPPLAGVDYHPEPPIVVADPRPLLDRIDACLRGDIVHNPYTVLRDARDEILQLRFAARCAMAAKGA